MCFFVVPFFNLTTKLGFTCLCSFSRQSSVNCDMKPKTIWAPRIWTMCLIRRSKLVFVLSWQIHLKFWCSLKCCQSIWSLRQHNKAVLLSPWTGSWWKCLLSVSEFTFMLVIWNPAKETKLPSQTHTHIEVHTFSQRTSLYTSVYTHKPLSSHIYRKLVLSWG